VIAVAVVARGCREILALVEHPGVDAAFIFLVLVVSNGVSFHVLGAGVAGRAGFRHVERIDRRERIVDLAHAVSSMTGDAGGYLCIACPKALTVNAGEIFSFLVDAKRRVELLHELGITVAPPAEPGHIPGTRAGDKAFARAHGLGGIIAGRIAAVTIGARKSPCAMNIGAHLGHWFEQGAFEGSVTVPARILLLSPEKGRPQQESDHKNSKTYSRPVGTGGLVGSRSPSSSALWLRAPCKGARQEPGGG